MKEITLEIGQLVDFISKKYNKEFKTDTFTEVPFKLQFPDHKGEWFDCKKIYQKEAPLYEIKFDNDAELKAADDHLLVDYDLTTKRVKDFEIGGKLFAYECISNTKISDNEIVYSPQIESDEHVYRTTNGLCHHNTYEVMQVCERYMKDSPTRAKYVYEAGDIGSSMSSLVPFFYKHRSNKIIVLDDNDKMIMANLSQDIMNIVKALLDPKAAETKPVTVRANMLKIFQARLNDLEEEDEVLKEGQHVFEIDVEALKENECVIAIDNNIVVNKKISLKEAQELSNLIVDKQPLKESRSLGSDLSTDDLRLYEAGPTKTNREFLSDLVGDDEDEYDGMTEEDKKIAKNMKATGATEQGEEGETFPRRFLFDSSVIFISNLEQDQINVAVLDRVESIGIKLSLNQFLQRLGSIYGSLCKGAKYSSVPQDLRDWAKKCVYTALGATLEAWRKKSVLWKTPVEINRKLTFRMFEEFVGAWIRYAYDRSERVDGKDLSDKAYRDKLAIELIPQIIRLKIIPFLKQRTRT